MRAATEYILDRSVINYPGSMVEAHAKRSVGRPREFDEEAALEAAMDAFWQKGYEATSLSDLCTCTGLHKGSLYQAFGDKHQLFMRALLHYADILTGQRLDPTALYGSHWFPSPRADARDVFTVEDEEGNEHSIYFFPEAHWARMQKMFENIESQMSDEE